MYYFLERLLRYSTVTIISSGIILCFVEKEITIIHPFFWVPLAISFLWAFSDTLQAKFEKQKHITDDLVEFFEKHAQDQNAPRTPENLEKAKVSFLVALIHEAVRTNKVDLLVNIGRNFHDTYIEKRPSNPTTTSDEQEIEI